MHSKLSSIKTLKDTTLSTPRLMPVLCQLKKRQNSIICKQLTLKIKQSLMHSMPRKKQLRERTNKRHLTRPSLISLTFKKLSLMLRLSLRQSKVLLMQLPRKLPQPPRSSPTSQLTPLDLMPVKPRLLLNPLSTIRTTSLARSSRPRDFQTESSLPPKDLRLLPVEPSMPNKLSSMRLRRLGMPDFSERRKPKELQPLHVSGMLNLTSKRPRLNLMNS